MGRADAESWERTHEYTGRKKWVTADADRSVEDCLAMMNERHIRHLPVMKGREVLGLISMRDVVRHLVEESGQTIHNLEKYIGGAM